MKITMLVVQGRPKGKSLRFSTGEFVIGRGHECHVRPNSPWVSRQHCLLRITRRSVHLRDLGSTNGSLVNGHLITNETELKQGDRIQVGPLVLQLVELAIDSRSTSQTHGTEGILVDATNETQPDLHPVKSSS